MVKSCGIELRPKGSRTHLGCWYVLCLVWLGGLKVFTAPALVSHNVIHNLGLRQNRVSKYVVVLGATTSLPVVAPGDRAFYLVVGPLSLLCNVPAQKYY